MRNNSTGGKNNFNDYKEVKWQDSKISCGQNFVRAHNKTKKRFRKGKMKPLIIDTFAMRRMQDFNQYNILNPININIGRSDHFRRFFEKYPAKNFTHRFCLTSITISSSIISINKEMLVTCTDLNDWKHSDTNRYENNVLAIIHSENILVIGNS